MNITDLNADFSKGDKIRRKRWAEGIYITNQQEAVPFKDALADDWEIKKKEEEPVTAEEYEKTTHYSHIKSSVDFYMAVQDAFKAGEKNNELKYKDLVDTLEKDKDSLLRGWRGSELLKLIK